MERAPRPAGLKARALRGTGRWIAGWKHQRALALGRLIGRSARRLLRQRAEVASINLAACFPELSETRRQRLLEETFQAMGMGLVETMIAFWGRPERNRERFRVQGLEILEQRDRSRGALLLMGHVPCAELLARLLNRTLDEPAAMLVRRNADPALEAVIDAGRRNFARTIEKKDMRAVMRQLRRGGALMYGPDLNFSHGIVFAPFFGVPAATLTATAELVARTGAQLIPVWGWRTAQEGYEIRVEAPWEDFPAGDALADATRVNRWIEERVREHPEQYHWLHRRFRNRPPGAPPIYPPRARRAKHR